MCTAIQRDLERMMKRAERYLIMFSKGNARSSPAEEYPRAPVYTTWSDVNNLLETYLGVLVDKLCLYGKECQWQSPDIRSREVRCLQSFVSRARLLQYKRDRRTRGHSAK